MTKLKNTKKGMAKKALSISLVAAMLATSNVPVWAAEDLFSDGTVVETEATVEEEASANVETFSSQEFSVEDVAEVSTLSAATVAVDAKINENGWGTAAGLDVKSFTAGALAATDDITYIWKVDGLEVARGTVKATETALKAIKYMPEKGDCDGELQLFLSYTDPNEEESDKNFSWESNKVTVSKHDIKNDGITITFKDAADLPTYDGKKHDSASEWVANYSVLNSDYNISVVTDKDFVNADSNISIKVTPKDTTYYSGEVSSTATVTLQKSTATDKLKVEYTGSEYTYTGQNIALEAKDFKLTDTLSGEVLDSSKYIDITAATGANGTNAGEYTAVIKTKDLVNYTTQVQTVTAENKWKINKADLSKCTVFLGEISEKTTPILTSDLSTITVSDGTHTLYNNTIAASDFVISNIQSNTGAVGTYTATVQTKADSTNFTGTSTTATFRVVRNALSSAVFDGEGDTTDPKKYYEEDEDFTGEAIVKDIKKLGTLMVGTSKLTAGIDYYENFEYSNNTNAGLASFTVTGKGSYEGSKKTFTFNIKPAVITNNGKMVSDKVGFVSDSTRKAEDYKDAIKVSLKAENSAKKAFTLAEGTDYKVEYAFKNVTLGNDITNKIVVKITLLNGNYGTKGTVFTEEVTLSKKQISDVTLSTVNSSYTYTGAAIVPELIVKDGEMELSKGEDYVVKSVSNNVNTGTATIVIAGAPNSDYDVDSTASTAFIIATANTENLVVNVDDQDYDGTKKKPQLSEMEIKLDGVAITDKFIVSYPTAKEANREVGTGTLTLTPDNGNKNFTGSKTVTFNIVGRKLTPNNDNLKLYNADGTLVTNAQKVFTYDGTAHTFAKTVATIFDGSKKLVEGTDYEIKYFHNISGADTGADRSTGTAYVAVVGLGNYAGDGSESFVDENGKTINYIAKQPFTINRLQLVPQNISVKNAEYAEGLPVKPQLTVTYGGTVLTQDKDFEFDNLPTVTTITSREYIAKVNGINGYYGSVDNLKWKVDKKDLANCEVTAVKGLDGKLSVTVMNGSVKVPAEKYVVTENDNGTVTVKPAENSKYYTGSKIVNVGADSQKPVAPTIQQVNVIGNKATVVLAGDTEGSTGYDYVISKSNVFTDKDSRIGVNANVLSTQTTFQYVGQGVYYAYLHSWKRVDGKKVFSDWSNAYPFMVSAITPEQPVITSVKVSGSTVKVTYTQSANATGYDIVLGKETKKVNGEMRPVNYGTLVSKIKKGATVTATFKNVPKGNYFAGLHAYNRTSENGTKVFSKWSNTKKVTVK